MFSFQSISPRVILVALASCLVCFSCQEYLEDELLSETSVDYLYGSPEGLEDGLVGLYTLNRSYLERGLGNNEHHPLVVQAKSDLTFGRAAEAAFFARLGFGRDLTTGGQAGLSHYWRNNYRVIDRANAIITFGEDVAFPVGAEADKARIIGEARAMRANSYFTLYRQFNNIFITTEPTSPENVFDLPQDKSSPEEIFALINSDLDAAIAALDWTTPEFGRWTKASASHLKAKVAMWQENWELAASLAESVINQGDYSLLSNTRDVFENDLNHSETLFAVQFEENVLGGGAQTQVHFNLAANYNEIPGITRSSENGGRGAGFLLPNQYLLDLLAEDEGDDRDDNTYIISAYLYNDADNLPEGKMIGDTVDAFKLDPSSSRTEIASYYRTLNPSVIKFQQRGADLNTTRSIRDVMIYRLAETYLISAEAHFRQGDNATALSRLNEVRTRAGAAPFTGTVTQETILDERARELFFEGQRFYTIKRMNVYVDYIRDHSGNNFLDNAGNSLVNAAFFIARERVMAIHRNWVIPEAEIDLLAPGYPQNDGY